MRLPLSRAVVDRLDLLDETGSTNAILVQRARSGTEQEFSVVATTSQTAGRGRLGRTWVAPPGKTIAASVLLTPSEGDRLSWLPLLAGLAMTRAVRSLVPDHAVTLKWPNDVQVDGLKVSGLLAELVPGVGVVIGAGLNLTMAAEELPTPVSTSLTLVGASPDDLVDRALAAYLRELRGLYDGWVAGADIRAQVAAECSTIGRSVRVELPSGDDLYGTATDIDGEGRLIVDGHTVAAGDVTHLRYV
ncbi:MAG: biotin--[acetyl-CoA-carboxylase] ligase [Salinibacterium sp.]|nr:biotin--[acetyl-CoA-carboxylase] ligase [Salinibacterium sp.]